MTGPTGTRAFPIVHVVFPDEPRDFDTPNVCTCGHIPRRTPDGVRLVRVLSPDCTSDAPGHGG